MTRTEPAESPSHAGAKVEGDNARARWESRTNLPLLALALVFLAAFLIPLYRPDLPEGIRVSLRVTNVLVWVAFAVDYAVRLRLSSDRRLFVSRHVPDLLTLAVPVLRPLRLLRVFGVLGSGSRRAGQTGLLQLRLTSLLWDVVPQEGCRHAEEVPS